VSTQQELDYRKIEKAIRFVQEHWQERPDLGEIAAHVRLSDFHFARLFKRWAGTTPKQFLQFLTKEHAKELLRRGSSVLEASHASGLSGPGRLHDLFIACEALTPGEAKSRGRDVVMEYGFGPTPFGEALLVRTSKGICALRFVETRGRKSLLDELKSEWPGALWRLESRKCAGLLRKLFSDGQGPGKKKRFKLQLQGTNFQIQVWQALLRIPEGALVTYGQLAKAVGRPKAGRAVGTAVGKNKIAVLIPCHRVIRESGMLGGYRWGLERKRSLIARESAASL
jgi:AraC family transcriptional regulator of adaptative response/methylated-DNA-[protein]-cysteine methyltransferase